VLAHSGAAELGPYRHYMQKEIFEQPRAIADTLEGVEGIAPELFDQQMNHAPGATRQSVCRDRQRCSSWPAAPATTAVARPSTGWRALPKCPTQVEVASEYRYRESVPNPKTLVVTITQSGETADTLAALRHAQSWA
jgi:glucosamine--fructose-6-phosphate aminotransferase (isomerizing)